MATPSLWIYTIILPTYSAYFRTLYDTSQSIYAHFSGMVIDFFQSLQKRGINLKNFPVHAEFKVIGTRLIPIEINLYRFGGYGLADMLHHACGINPYETYFESPDTRIGPHYGQENPSCAVA